MYQYELEEPVEGGKEEGPRVRGTNRLHGTLRDGNGIPYESESERCGEKEIVVLEPLEKVDQLLVHFLTEREDGVDASASSSVSDRDSRSSRQRKREWYIPHHELDDVDVVLLRRRIQNLRRIWTIIT